MNIMTRNPGCRRACRLDFGSGFVIEDGCPVHDREGYTPFTVKWIIDHPCLIGTLSLCEDEGAEHEHIAVACFLIGLN